jgi:hypothetical protein
MFQCLGEALCRLCVMALPCLPAAAAIDGDTIALVWPTGAREIVRLAGIDAPETGHRRAACASAAWANVPRCD